MKNEDLTPFLVSHWKGFEIDSSEGYYAFENNLEAIEAGWDFLEKLLSSSLLWQQVSFTLQPMDKFRQYVDDYLKKKYGLGIIREFEYKDAIEKADAMALRDEYDYTDMEDDHLPSHIDPEYQTVISRFLEIFQHLKTFLSLISVNFCIKPLIHLSEVESVMFHSWFLSQFKDKKEARRKWLEYTRVKEKKFELRGNCEADYAWETHSAFEGNFEIFSGHPPSFRINLPAVDPSLLIYLVSTLINQFRFVLRGRPQLMDHKPERLRLQKRDD